MFLVERKCPVCGVVYGLDPDFYKYREQGGKKDGSKANWYCPNGHSLIIMDSEADQMRRERDRLQQRIAEKDDDIKRLQRETAAARGQVTKIRKRVHAGVCTDCHRTFPNLAAHMKSKHSGEADGAQKENRH